MTTTLSPSATPHAPWNKGKLVGQKPPLKLWAIWTVRTCLRMAGKTRDLALFNLAIDSKLRGCDLVSLHVRDVAHGNHIMLATLQRLGVMPSFSRPSVSDDNTYSEALFKTLKYPPGAPSQPFASLEDARQWVARFASGYNETHRHSALHFVTPGQRHRGEDRALLDQRCQLYAAARARHPERWSGAIRHWEPDTIVCLNPGRLPKQEANNTPNAT